MVKFRIPGIHSSLQSDYIDRLIKLTSHPALQKIKSAINTPQLYLVGGTVRDTALGVESKDFDLACDLKPEEMISRLSKQSIHCVPTGIDHGTITAVVDQHNIEITTFRVPGKRNRDRPENLYSKDITIDLEGRDFTINAMAFSLSGGSFIDPFHGIEDLKHDTLRAVKDPSTRFSEDPLRILRMLRFGPAQSRKIDNATLKAASNLYSSINEVSTERVTEEFLKILCSKNASDALRLMRKIKILDIILPEIVSSYDFEQNEYHRFDVFEHTLAVIDNAERTPLQRLTALFHDLGKPHTLSVGDDGRRHFYKHELVSSDITRKVMKRMKLSNELTKGVYNLVRHHMRPIECGPAGLRRLQRDLDNYFEEWLLFKRADALGAKVGEAEFDQALEAFMQMVNEENERIKLNDYRKLAITGDDLKELGLNEGVKIGQILGLLREQVLDDPAKNSREYLLGEAKKLLISA